MRVPPKSEEKSSKLFVIEDAFFVLTDDKEVLLTSDSLFSWNSVSNRESWNQPKNEGKKIIKNEFHEVSTPQNYLKI